VKHGFLVSLNPPEFLPLKSEKKKNFLGEKEHQGGNRWPKLEKSMIQQNTDDQRENTDSTQKTYWILKARRKRRKDGKKTLGVQGARKEKEKPAKNRKGQWEGDGLHREGKKSLKQC